MPKESVCVCECMYVCAYVCCAEERGERKQEESSREDEKASISFLEPSHDIIYAKQPVVA